MEQQLTALVLAISAIFPAMGAQSMSGPIGSGSGRASMERHAAPPPRPAQIARPASPPAMPAQRLAAPPAPRPAPPVVVQAARPPIMSAIPAAPRPAQVAPAHNELNQAKAVSPPPAVAAKPLVLPPAVSPAPPQPRAVEVKGHVEVVQGKLSTTAEYGDPNKAVRVNLVTGKDNRVGHAEVDTTVGRANRTQVDAGAAVDEGKLSRASIGVHQPNGNGGNVVVSPKTNGDVDIGIQINWGY